MHKPILKFLDSKCIGYSGFNPVKSYIENYVLYDDGSKGYLYSEHWYDKDGFIKQSILSEEYPFIERPIYPDTPQILSYRRLQQFKV